MLVSQPSMYARAVEAISTILRNMHFLLNTLRCHQVCATATDTICFSNSVPRC